MLAWAREQLQDGEEKTGGGPGKSNFIFTVIRIFWDPETPPPHFGPEVGCAQSHPWQNPPSQFPHTFHPWSMRNMRINPGKQKSPKTGKCRICESLNGALANGGLRCLSTIVQDCLRFNCRPFATKVPLWHGPKTVLLARPIGSGMVRIVSTSVFPIALQTCSELRGPAAILFISRDTCSDSIAELVRAFFLFFIFYGVSHNYRAICCKMGYRTDVPV